MRLGQTITDIRKQRGMTQEEFARIFHVTRQTVSNWEKEKNYPDLETLVRMSEEFDISLDAMLKEDKQMVKKMNKEIKFSQNFKRNAIRILVCVVIVSAIGAAGWGIAWNSAKNSLETSFREGVVKNDFHFDEQLGYYTKMTAPDSYYVLPNQSMPDYFEFVLHYYAMTLDYYTVIDGNNIQIRWTAEDGDDKILCTVWCLDEYGNINYELSEKQEKELCEGNTNINRIFKEGEKICKDVYKA